jgi:hypothetical protein
MTEYDDLGNPIPEDGGSLRRQLEEALKAKKELEKERDSLRSTSRKATIDSVISTRKLSPKLASLIPENVTDKGDVEKWLDDYADVFAPSEKPAEEQKPAQQTPPQNTVPAPGTQLTQEQMFELFQQVMSGAQPSTLPDGRDPYDALNEAAEGGLSGIDQFMREQGLTG